MKNRLRLLVVIVAAIAFVSCEPVENRQEMKGTVTEADVRQQVTVTPETTPDGKRSNYLLLKANNLKASLMYEYELGTYNGNEGRIKSCIVPGEYSIFVTALSPGGTKVGPVEFIVNVDVCLDVEPEWELLCGTGSKTWTWDEDADPDCYGMGDVFDDTPGWWTPAEGGDVDELEWHGATMTFSAKGATLTKNKTDGNTERGTFSFDMTKSWPGYSRSLGQLYTKGITVLNGNAYGDDDAYWKGGPVDTYEIIKLTENELVLIIVDMEDGSFEPDSEGWGQSTQWLFKTVEE